LNRLIQQKNNLAGSLGLIPSQSVNQEELFGQLFGGETEASDERAKPISLSDAVKLSWDLFEALIAYLYEDESEQVILTPQGRDHGADVIVIGHRVHGNILVQVKTTGGAKLDSETAVR